MRPAVSRGTRIAAVASLTAAAAVLVLLLTRGLSDQHTLRAAFSSASQVVAGQDVRLAGREVGEVESVDLVDGQAVLELRIEDRAWPLHRGTTARLRHGTTTGYVARYVEFEPGPPSAPPLKDGGVLGAGQTVTPVEFDEMYRILDAEARRDLKGLLSNFADTLEGREQELGTGISAAARGLDETASFMRELGADPAALRTLVDSGARASAAIASREHELRDLVTNAAATFDEFAQHTEATRASFERFPRTLRVTRTSLGRLDQSLAGLTALVGDVRPGAGRLRELAPVVRRATSTLLDVAPLATSALRRGRLASPPIRALLREGTPFIREFGRVLREFAPQMKCLRPQAPEIISFFSTWAAFSKNYDAVEHYNRGLVTVIPMGADETRTSAEVVSQSGGAVRYGFPTPPGTNVDQPWFIPECGYGPEGLDPTRDPESRK